MIVVWDPEIRGHGHQLVNSAIFEAVLRENPDEEVIFCSESEHSRQVIALVDPTLLRSRKPSFYSLPSPPERHRFLSSLLYQRKCGRMISSEFRAGVITSVVVLTGQTSLLFSIWFRNNNFPRETKITILWHSLLNSLLRRPALDPVSGLLPLGLRLSRNKNLRHLVMNPFAFEKLRSFGLGPSNTCFIHHPVPRGWYQPRKESQVISASGPLIFATLGRGHSRAMEKLATMLLDEKEIAHKFELWTIGGVRSKISGFEFIREFFAPGLISRQELAALSRQVDFFLFPYPRNAHRLSASGALFDALAYEKPVIFTPNDYFDWYYTRYRFGYRCKNIEEMRDTIVALCSNQGSVPSQLISEIQKFKKEMSAQQLSILRT